MRLLWLLLAPLALVAQPVRYDAFVQTTNQACVPGSVCPLLVVPGATVTVCTDSLCTVPATTYQSAIGSACPINAQVTIPGTAICRSTSGPNGDFGFWLNSGTYYFTIRLPNGVRRGPYPLSVGGAGGGSGSVTSVGLSLPNIFTVTGSPVTTTGTLTGTLASQSQNLFLASPNGSSGLPSFRALVGTEVVSAFSGCSGVQYLGADAACHSVGVGGTVTSVGATFTGGIIGISGSTVTTAGTFGFTVAGTSGGVPYFSGSTTWGSSGTLTSGQLLFGGGAGNPPTSGNLTGDATTTNSAAVTVKAINGTLLSSLATGILKNTTTTGVPSIATSTDVVATFSGCSGIQYLGADGACHNSTGFGYFFTSITTPNTVYTIGSDCSSTTPCNVQVGDTTSAQVCRFTTPGLVTLTGGSDTWRFYVDSSCVLSAGTPGAGTATCSGCTVTALGGANFPGGSSPLFTATSSSGAWVTGVGALTDFRAPLSNKPNTLAGFGLTQSANTIAIDTTLPAFAALTDGATVTWAIANGIVANASLTFTVHSGSRTLNLTGLVSGGSYVLKLKQDSTGGEGLTLGTGCAWIVSNGGSGAVTPSTGANAVDVLAFTYDGTSCIANFAKNFN